ncbi:MAG: Rrf2 family transcriptional regulator [Candidatus Marinimicrobia bacterium]|nr:Rrf2 family transcriptional regulator [Candidatus Neomarinimicrobiota bacterium]
MLLSKTSEYAIRLVLCLSRHPGGEYIPIKKIADQSGISYFQLGKVAQRLIKAHILDSYTGPNGGVALARQPSEIRLYDIVSAIEGPDLFDRCVLGLEGCGEANHCPIHNYWKNIKGSIMTLFREKSLDEFADLETGDTLLESKVVPLVR